MNRVLSRAQIRELDRIAIESFRIPGLLLMENAGRGAAERIFELLPGGDPLVVIVCGTGNNGGDGFVVARQLQAWGVQDVAVWIVGDPARVKGDARVNLDAWTALGGEVSAAWSEDELRRLEGVLEAADVVVDALFGTGLDRAVGEPFARVISAINASAGRCVALDLPSGLDADTGAALGTAVRADTTMTFGALKLGLVTPNGADHAGEVHVASLGIPERIVERSGWSAEIIRSSDVFEAIAPRSASAHKHSAGDVLVIAGRPGKIGASLLAARGALRAGAGLATIATWPDAVGTLQGLIPEVMTAPISPADVAGSLDELLRGRDAVAVGPGFGLDELARSAVERVVLGWDGVKVVDADGLTVFAGRASELSNAPGKLILTPHPGEMGRLLGRSGAEVERDRFGAVREAAERTGSVVVLKGARTLVAWPGGIVQVNEAGSRVLATAGSGDVLCGVIAALACTLPAERAAVAGVHLHALAGEAWERDHRCDRGMLASEIAEGLPSVMAADVVDRDV